MSKLKLFIPLTKIDVEKRLVYGTLVEEAVDKSKEIMDYASSKPNFEKWSNSIEKASGGKSMGNLRVMHTTKVAGLFKQISFDDENKRIEGCGHVVDEDEWQKCLKGAYTGFSVGGSYAKRWKDKDNAGVVRYTAGPEEISLVDNPCVHSATFELVKADGTMELRKFVTPPVEDKAKDEAAEIEAKARELCKAAGKDPEANVLNKLADGTEVAVYDWHGFIEDAKKALKPDDQPFLQKWHAPDGKAFDKKEEARSYWDAEQLKKQATETAKPATDILDKIDAALTKAEGAADKTDKTEDDDLMKSLKAAGLEGEALAKAHAAASPFTKPVSTDVDDDEDEEPCIVGKLKKGMSTISRLASLIQDLEWLRCEVRYEEDSEGDGSTMAKSLNGHVLGLCTSLQAMVAEECAEIVAKGMDAADIAKSVTPSGADALLKLFAANGDNYLNGKELIEPLTKIVGDHKEKLAKIATGDGAPEMAKLASENGALTKVVGDLTDRLTKVLGRVEALEAMPAEPKGVRRITKRQDNSDDDDRGPGTGSAENIEAILMKMAPEDRAMAIMKAAMANGKVISN